MKSRIKLTKKKVFIISAIVAIMVLGGVIWWFIPYFHVLQGRDKHAGYKYYIEKDMIYLSGYMGSEKIVHVPKRLKGRKVVIDSYCFAGTNVEEVYIPLTVEMKDSAFRLCDKLRKVQGSSNRIIYSTTFAKDECLEEVSFGNEIESIERGAFMGCKRLKSIDFIETVKYLNSTAFTDTAVEEIPVMENLEYVGSYVFKGTPWEEKQEGDFIVVDSTLQLYKGLEEIVHIPEGVTAIRAAFRYREEEEYPIQVKEVYIPSSVKSLGRNIFDGQESVKIYIPNSVTEIEVIDGKTYAMEGNVKIITTSGSYAEEYAREYGVEYEIVDGWD
ncbi:MAG: leucine-rich repeat domain-containing protein [Lachnospiraceae bacterium]|nr:leucine-rich repeat domain-containing protein [Lachnospiraceae bacterium]